MQTILGAGGAVGRELAKALTEYTDEIRLVSRKPEKINDADKLFPADLTVKENVYKAVEGSEVCYLTAGFPYSKKVWRKVWPPLIKNVVDACIKNGSKLVFFDNVYAIGGDNVKHITESSPVSPVSVKGKIRAEAESYIIDNSESGKLDAIIARSPDFFSADKANSIMMNIVYDNLKKGKKAQWFCNADVIHSMGYVPDLAKGTAKLGSTPDAYNQVWNLPVDKNALTGRQWVKLFADEMNAPDAVKVLPAWLFKVSGPFVPLLKEMVEMLYQFDRDYYFDSSKFVKKINYTPTSNEEAVRQTVVSLKSGTI